MLECNEKKNHHSIIDAAQPEIECNPFGSGEGIRGGFFNNQSRFKSSSAAYHHQYTTLFTNTNAATNIDGGETTNQEHPPVAAAQGMRRERCNSGISSVTQTD